jgi:hypothetical protein
MNESFKKAKDRRCKKIYPTVSSSNKSENHLSANGFRVGADWALSWVKKNRYEIFDSDEESDVKDEIIKNLQLKLINKSKKLEHATDSLARLRQVAEHKLELLEGWDERERVK